MNSAYCIFFRYRTFVEKFVNRAIELLIEIQAQKFVVVPAALLIGGVSFAIFQPVVGAVSCLLGLAMLAITLEDAKRFIIPDIICLPMIPAGLIAAKFLSAPVLADEVLLAHLGASVLGGGALLLVRYGYQAFRAHEGLGLGDVKLAAVAGAWTGMSGIGSVLLIACAVAIVYVGAMAIHRSLDLSRTTAVPFGAFLAPSIWLVWAYGHL